MAEVHRAYAALVREAQARGEVSTDADVEFLAEMIAGSMTMLLNNWINEPRLSTRSSARRRPRASSRTPSCRRAKVALVEGASSHVARKALTICPLSDAAAMPVESYIRKFYDEFAAHIEQRHCIVA